MVEHSSGEDSTYSRNGARSAARLYAQPSASASFSLAMSLGKMGHAAEARSAYESAVSRQRATYPQDPRLVRAELESSRVLGGRGR
jgi:hypothetical protein